MTNKKPGPAALTDLGIDNATIRKLAVEADADPRSVIAELRAARGQRSSVRGLAGHRVRRVLVAHGLIGGGGGGAAA